MTSQLLEEGTTQSIIRAFYEVYNVLGLGLLEKAYSGALAYELELRGHLVSRESPAEIRYKERIVARYRTDMVVDDRVIIENKSTTRLTPDDHRQVINFLRATRWEVGLLLHFGPKAQFHRFVSSNQDPLKYGARAVRER
jgi:GxxExxY protein